MSKITQLSVSNFQGLSGVHEFDLSDSIQVRMDKNGTGKSSMVNALRYALTGAVPAGSVAHTLGTGGCAVKVTFDDGTYFARKSVHGKPTICIENGHKVGAKQMAEDIAKKTGGVPSDMMKLFTQGELLSNMKPADFEKFLSAFTGLTKKEDLLDYAEAGMKAANVKDEVKEDTKAFLDRLFKQENVSSQEIDAVYAQEYKLRTKLRRDYQKSDGEVTALGRNSESPKKTRDELVKVRDEAEAQQKQAAAYQEKVRTYQRALADYQKAKEQIKSLEAEIAKLPESAPDAKETEELKKKLEEKNGLLDETRTTESDFAANVRAMAKAIETLDQPVCPLSEKLKCTTDKSGIRKELEDAKAAAEKAQAREGRKIKKLEKECAEITEKMNAVIKQQADYEKRMFLVKQKETLEASTKEEPKAPEKLDTDGIDEKVRVAVKAVDDYDRYQVYMKKRGELIKVKKNLDVVEQTVNVLAPKGPVRTEITKHFIKDLEDACNERAKELGVGREIRFLVNDAGVTVYAKMKEDGHHLRLQDLSGGETVLIEFVLLDVFSRMAGCPVIIMDELSVLDQEGFAEILKLVKEHKDDYLLVLLSLVDHDDMVQTAKNEGLPIYHATDTEVKPADIVGREEKESEKKDSENREDESAQDTADTEVAGTVEAPENEEVYDDAEDGSDETAAMTA